MRAPTQITLLILLAVTLATTASAAPNFVIRRDSDIGGFAIARDGSLKGEIDAFGAPSSRQVFGYDTCMVAWSKYGIQSEFAHNFGDPCDSRGCHSETTISQRQWRTDKGLHVGDPLKRLRQLYPKAKRYIGKNWALIRRPFGGTLVPTLLATIKTCRVSAFVIKSPWLLTC